MNRSTKQNQQYFYARMAGLSYLVFTVAGLIKNFLLNGKLADISTLQLNGLFANELHFRLGIFAEIVMFIAVVTASTCFYVVLKPVHKPLAKTALCFRMVEIIVGSVAVVFSMAMLAISNKAYLLDVFEPEQIRTLLVITASLIMPAYEYSWIFMGFAGVITFYLFYKMRFIPRGWSIWGMITYTSLILYPVAKLLIADLPREVMFVMFPGALFELTVGIWLLIKGIDNPTS